MITITIRRDGYSGHTAHAVGPDCEDKGTGDSVAECIGDLILRGRINFSGVVKYADPDGCLGFYLNNDIVKSGDCHTYGFRTNPNHRRDWDA